MSAIGRIFIVLNLVLAAAFLGWASSANGTTDNWKKKFNDEVAAKAEALAEKDAEISDLRGQISSLEDGQRTFREERDDAKARVTELEGALADAKRENADLGAKIAEINATLGDYNQTIASLVEAKDAAIERAHEAEKERDDAVDQAQAAELARRDAEEAANMASAKIAELEKANAQLSEKVSSLETEIGTLVAITGVSRNQFEAVPEIEGAVLEADTDSGTGLVVLNVGKDKGVKRGYVFHVYRGNQYKGEVRVENVQDGFCSAVVVGTANGRQIAQGDRATTIL